jgi:hypothetical protein
MSSLHPKNTYILQNHTKSIIKLQIIPNARKPQTKQLKAQKHLHFASAVVSDVLSQVMGGHGQHQWILTGLQESHQYFQQLVVLLIETTGVFSPKLVARVDGRPLQAPGLHFRGVLVKRRQVLYGRLEFLTQEVDVLFDVHVVKLLTRLL